MVPNNNLVASKQIDNHTPVQSSQQNPKIVPVSFRSTIERYY